MNATVKSYRDAQPGDVVWVWRNQKTRMVNGKYEGRGVWETAVVTRRTYQSIIIGRGHLEEKFKIDSGFERARGDFSSGDKIAGNDERELELWSSWRTLKAFEEALKAAPLDAVKQAAFILGVEVKT